MRASSNLTDNEKFILDSFNIERKEIEPELNIYVFERATSSSPIPQNLEGFDFENVSSFNLQGDKDLIIAIPFDRNRENSTTLIFSNGTRLKVQNVIETLTIDNQQYWLHELDSSHIVSGETKSVFPTTINVVGEIETIKGLVPKVDDAQKKIKDIVPKIERSKSITDFFEIDISEDVVYTETPINNITIESPATSFYKKRSENNPLENLDVLNRFLWGSISYENIDHNILNLNRAIGGDNSLIRKEGTHIQGKVRVPAVPEKQITSTTPMYPATANDVALPSFPLRIPLGADNDGDGVKESGEDTSLTFSRNIPMGTNINKPITWHIDSQINGNIEPEQVVVLPPYSQNNNGVSVDLYSRNGNREGVNVTLVYVDAGQSGIILRIVVTVFNLAIFGGFVDLWGVWNETTTITIPAVPESANWVKYSGRLRTYNR